MDRKYSLGGHSRNYGKILQKIKPGDPDTGKTKIGDIATGNIADKVRHEHPTTDLGPFKAKQESREIMAETDGELLKRANRFGGGYQPLEECAEEGNE